jgi:putative transposase
MGRLPRAIADGLVYHALNRDNNLGRVFADDADHLAFLEALRKTKERYPFRLLGHCLMSDQFHLLSRGESGQTISRILKSLTAWHYHKRHRSSGHVWQGRFRSPLIQDDGHLLTVLRFIEANPVRANLVLDPSDYRWSSYGCHGLGEDDPLLSPIRESDKLGRTASERRKRWRAKVCARQKEGELTAVRNSLRSGRPFGADEWTERIAKRLNIDLTHRKRGRPRKVKKN